MAGARISRRRFVLSCAAAAAGSAFSGTGAVGASAVTGPLEKPRLTLGIPVDAASFLPVYVAAARTFKEQGLDVELVSFRGDAEVAQALAGNSVDISLQSLDGLINLINAGQSVRGFYA